MKGGLKSILMTGRGIFYDFEDRDDENGRIDF